MSLTRKFLSALGIEDDKAEQIINAHLETVNPLKQERDDLKDKAGQITSIQKELDTAKGKLKEYEESGDKDSWKVKYDAAVEDKKNLQKQFDDYKADIDAKNLLEKKQIAYKQLLADAGIPERRHRTVLRVTDLNKYELTEDGKFKDSDSVTEAIKSEWSDFIVAKETKGADVPNPPAGNNGADGGVKVPPVQSRAAKLASAYYKEHYGSKED